MLYVAPVTSTSAHVVEPVCLYLMMNAFVFLLPTSATEAVKLIFAYVPSSFVVPSSLHRIALTLKIFGFS